MKKKLLAIITGSTLIAAAILLPVSEGLSQSVDSTTTKSIEDISLEDLMKMSVKVNTGSFLDLDLKSSPLSMSVITEDQISLSGARHLSELLEIYVPGFQYIYNKWGGVIWGMRGVAADRNTKILYLVNGHQMNTESRDGAISEVNLGLLSDIDRVEVIRGPAGLTYGSGAIAGVINVVTKSYKRDAIKANGGLQNWDGKTNAGQMEVMVNKKIGQDLNIGASGGYMISQGTSQSRLYGMASWPYPGWSPASSYPQDGVPTSGNAWSTPGNYRASLNVSYKDIKFYSRFTNQVTNASGYFILDPFLAGSSSTSGVNAVIDGQNHGYNDPFWSNVQAYNTNRRQYVISNWTNQLSYTKTLGQNELKLDAGFDMVTNRIQVQSINDAGFANRNLYGATNEGLESKYSKEGFFFNQKKGMFMPETFGEQRYSIRGIYMINTIKRLKLAIGYQGRAFVFGKDMNGWNMQNENDKHIIVTNTVYLNNAIFAEGMYNLIDKKLDIGFAARYDAHTRTIAQGGVFNPKLALIWKPSQDHVIKVIYQTSANNGSADNYEFNRNSVNDNGEPLSGTTYRFEKPLERPNSGNNNILAPVSQSDLYKLKPERSSSIELASVHQFGKSLLIQPSISYNSITDLFIWNQAQFRVLNGGNYNFFNFELEAKYNTEKIKFGINHALQRVVNTDINQTVSYTTPIFSGYDSTVVNGVMTYSPKVRNVPGKNTDTTYYLNTISGSITRDGSNFLSLASNVTKVYFDYSITKWLTVHTDARVFWGLPGRQWIQDQNPAYPSLGAYNNAMIRWNLAVHFKVTKSLKVSLHGYDLLSGVGSRNSLRWQQMGEPSQGDLFGSDLRSFAVKVQYEF